MPTPSTIPYFLLMALYLAFAHIAVRYNRFYTWITSPAAQGRYESLDGLRGFLALGVFFHHAVVTHAAYVTGQWSSPEGFFGLLGPGSVTFFFIITGFLFWSKAICNGAKIGAIKLWRNRLLRIAPMCLFSILIMLSLAAVQSGFRLREPLGNLIWEVLGCLSLGVFVPRVNGVGLGRFNAHVFWTLRYEWCFYIAIPLLAWFATPKRLPWLCVLVLIFNSIIAPYVPKYAQGAPVFFLIGMVAAQLVATDWLGRYFRSTVWPLLTIALLTIATAVHSTAWQQWALYFLVFMAIAHDSSPFAFLRWRATKFLGTISYSVYLLHGIVLFVVFNAVNHIVPVESITQCGFWSIVGCCGLLTILVSAMTYRFVEHPFLSAKRPVLQRDQIAPGFSESGTAGPRISVNRA
jgi:peptidoglycan/LPS O-acetylase OafA/YrhL